MSQHQPTKNVIPRDFKYPLFFLGLFVLVVGELGAQQLNLSLEIRVVIAVVGFLLLMLGIVLE
jgi:hypothetical protein